MATAANTRITESGVIVGAQNAGEVRVTESGVVLGAKNAGEVRITESGLVVGAKDQGEVRITLSGVIFGLLPCAVPAAPSGFTATSKGAKVVLSWTDPGVTGETVNVFRSTSPGNEVLIKSGITAALGTYTDTVPAVGIPYYYQIDFVSPCGSGTEGTKTGELSITPQCCQGDATASAVPSTVFTASAAPASTGTFSTPPASSGTFSTPPTTVFTASTPPTSVSTPSGCPG